MHRAAVDALGHRCRDHGHDARSGLGLKGVEQTEALVGLTSSEASARLRQAGPNSYGSARRIPAALTWVAHIASDPMVVLLVAAAAVYLWLDERTDAIAALIALVPIALLDIALELRADRALDELRRLTAPTARVLRDGALVELPTHEIVPGDVIDIREGDVVAADGLIGEATQLHVDESPLTGEAEPIAKSASADADLFAGTRVLSGRGRQVVTATGKASRYGAIADVLARTRPPRTPLQLAIRRLFLLLTAVAVIVCVLVVGLEVARGATIVEALVPGIGLAMAAIPEEIPVVTTLYLGLGAWRLARDRALMRRLSGVETLGMTTAICTDKTGTLTEGRVRLVGLTPDGVTERQLLEAAVLASEPDPFDPLDRAIARAAVESGIDVGALHARVLLRDHPFDPVGKYVSHVWTVDGRATTYAKGSPETIAHLGLAGGERASVVALAEDLARQGQRIVAVGRGPTERMDAGRTADERGLRHLGLLAFADPLRPDAVAAIEECRRAGIKVYVVTGDHPGTAAAVALRLGIIASAREVLTGDEVDRATDAELIEALPTTRVFARMRPEQKLRLVRTLRARGEVVAVTGDGINDGPALREAHIGVAMGRSGTAVAREAATLVLLDDDFTTIVRSVKDGRRIFDNLGRAISYLIGFHIPLVLAALIVPIAGAPLLLLPLHLVWLEVIVHPTASLVFEADAASPDLMRRPPRSAASLLPSRAETALALLRGVLLTAGVVGLFLGTLPRGEDLARSLAVTALIAGQCLLVVTARAGVRPIWRVPVRSAVMAAVIGSSLATAAGIPAVPPLAAAFHMRPLDPAGWALALATAAVAVLVPEVAKVRWPFGPTGGSVRRSGSGPDSARQPPAA